MSGSEGDFLGMAPRHWELVRALLRRYVPEAEVLAYGSRVTGRGHEASDLDLVVRDPEDLQAEVPGVAALREALVESDLPIRVDLMAWARMPEGFQQAVMASQLLVQSGRGEGG